MWRSTVASPSDGRGSPHRLTPVGPRPDDLAGLPDGWPVQLDGRLRIRGRTIFTPTGRMLTLGPQGLEALADVQLGKGSRAFARRLVQAGAAHPRPPAHPTRDVTVVIPVRDRTSALARCLAVLDRGNDVLVVDDGSANPLRVEAVCREFAARYVRRPNGGPAAARNTALSLVDKDFVAFLDSDCVAPEGWLERLRGHFEDPSVVAVAPRVAGGPRSPLDLGSRPATVQPGGEVAYVPTAALIVRRSALPRFDESLRYGEDVDLVWRLIDAGGVVRYDPSVVVEHEEPDRLSQRLARRFRYGTSAAALGERHPDRLAHLVLPPWPTAVLALLLGRRPLAALTVAVVATRRLDAKVHDPRSSAWLVARSVEGTALGVGRALSLLGPLAWLAARNDRRVTALLVAPYLREWAERRPGADPLTYTATALLDQAAYGTGVLAGCVTHRTVVPIAPRWH